MNKLEEIASAECILTPSKQRVVWARLTTIKQLLIRHGLTTHEEFEATAAAMVRDIDLKVLQRLQEELGIEGE